MRHDYRVSFSPGTLGGAPLPMLQFAISTLRSEPEHVALAGKIAAWVEGSKLTLGERPDVVVDLEEEYADIYWRGAKVGGAIVERERSDA